MSNRCILPWISLETTPLGGIRPCCLVDTEINDVDVRTHTLEQVFRGKHMQDLRNEFKQDLRPKQCERCWREEDAGKKSKRQYMLDKFKHLDVDYTDIQGYKLQFLDLKLGNICNLKCRICGSWSSSSWAQEDIAQHGKEHIATDWLRLGGWPRKSKMFWEHMDNLLPDIKYFEFTGGEPFLIKQHFDLLQQAVDTGYAKDIDIHYNTNGTQFPKQHKVWKNFKRVQIAFSIDNVGKRFEYERDGANWDTVNQNITKFHELKDRGYPFDFQICVTWNIQNTFYMSEFLTWAKTQSIKDIHFNLMHDPWEFSLFNLPASSKEILVDSLENTLKNHPDYAEKISSIKFIVSDLSNATDGSALITKLTEKDKFRNIHFSDSHKEIAQAIGYEL